MIDNIWRESGFEVLIVGGHHAEVPRFLDCLTHEPRGRLAGTSRWTTVRAWAGSSGRRPR